MCDCGIGFLPKATWHFVHWNFGSAFRLSASKLSAPPSSVFGVTWHIAQFEMLTFIDAQSAVFILAAV